jgi:hypothetical protein
MRYNIYKGVEREKSKTRRGFITAFAALTVMAVAAAPASAASGNANQQACFGQARASTATTVQGGVGEAASDRKGTNAFMNTIFRENCQD